jgi:hypothetical protein
VKLDLHFIIPGPTPGSILVDADGRLPMQPVDRNADEATVVAATTDLRERLGFASPILETHPKWEGVPDDEPIPTLVTTEPAPADWTPPAGFTFGATSASLDGVPPPLHPRARELLDELRTGSPPPALRPRWARPGWNARAVAWMTRALDDAGRPLLEEPQPFGHRGISALLRGRTAAGDVFLKAVFPPFHSEPVVTLLLAERFPESVPRVLAVEPDEGWLVVEDVAAPWVGDLPADQRVAGLVAGVRSIVRMELALVGDLAVFVDAGCPVRPIANVAAELDAALGPAGVAHVEGPVSDERRARATAATGAAVERVASLGFPTTLVHGDFHAGNVAFADGRAVIIDWSDAAIGIPTIDLVTWLAWSRDSPDQQQVAIDAWIDAWAGPTDPVAVRAAIDDILIVGAAYQVVSYDRIVRALEPATRYTMSDGAKHYLERLEERLAPRVAT